MTHARHLRELGASAAELHESVVEALSKPNQKSKMELYSKIINGF